MSKNVVVDRFPRHVCSLLRIVCAYVPEHTCVWMCVWWERRGWGGSCQCSGFQISQMRSLRNRGREHHHATGREALPPTEATPWPTEAGCKRRRNTHARLSLSFPDKSHFYLTRGRQWDSKLWLLFRRATWKYMSRALKMFIFILVISLLGNLT